MITINKRVTKGEELKEVSRIEYGCWIDLVNPTRTELEEISEKTGAFKDHLKAPLDEDERSRIDIEDGSILFIFRIPYMDMVEDRTFTIPLGIVITGKNVITICLKENAILKDFYENKVKSMFTNKKTRFLLQILLRTNSHYIKELHKIEACIDKVEKRLLKAFRNEDMITLMDIEKTLVYFNTAVVSNENVLDKIRKGRVIKLYHEDEDLLEDIIIENKQAIEMVKIYSNIVSGTMDAYASLIANNLNAMMKVLTSLTIIVSLPLIVIGLYGMNVTLPLQEHPSAFLFILAASAIITTITTFIFLRKNWL